MVGWKEAEIVGMRLAYALQGFGPSETGREGEGEGETFRVPCETPPP